MAQYHSIQPDLIIVCSFRMDPEDKLNVIKKIRWFDKRVPIILITRFSTESRAIAALRAGVSDYFKVPFSSETLIQRIFRLLSDSKLETPGDNQSDKVQFDQPAIDWRKQVHAGNQELPRQSCSRRQ